jgi:hypothetical protein
VHRLSPENRRFLFLQKNLRKLLESPAPCEK